MRGSRADGKKPVTRSGIRVSHSPVAHLAPRRPCSSPFSRRDTLARPLTLMDAFFSIAAPVPAEETEAEASQVPADYDHANGNAAFSCVVS